jgi:cytochrome P450
MRRKNKPAPVDLQAFDKAKAYQQNRMLLEWLSDDGRRKELYAAVNADLKGVLRFPSLARYDELPTQVPRPPESRYRYAYLLTGRSAVEAALRNPDDFSNSPYVALGSGSFMLAIDPEGEAGERRKLQVDAARRVFRLSTEQITGLCDYAFSAALPTALGASPFDLALLAEEVALRFCSALFGFAAADYPLLEEAQRKGYQALNMQILGRHFVSDPRTLPAARQAMAALLARAAQLIDEYQLDDCNLPEDIEGQGAGLPRFEPVMRALGLDTGELTGEERAVLVVGALIGTVGNVQASVCIALQSMLAYSKCHPNRDLVAEARELLHADRSGQCLWPWLAEGLRHNPPVAFVPRRARRRFDLGNQTVEVDDDCVLALGGACGDRASYPQPPCREQDPLIFGLDNSPFGRGVHWCLGKYLAEPLIQRICAGVLRLPSLAEELHAVDGLPIGLQKQWGFACVEYKLRHRRELRFLQQPLNVVMRIKTPTAANAQALRGVIRYGAPRIEAVLRESRHVHFAWFEFIESDSVLVLHTVFDGDFDAYLQHFALVVGDVFDRLFKYIEDAPPLPVCDFPNEFVKTIRRFHRPAAVGYFFSAYPDVEAAQITRFARGRP